MNELLRWCGAFALTLIIELPLAAVLLRRFEARPARLWPKLVFANLATHPLLWFGFPLAAWPGAWSMLAAELFAWLCEAAFYIVVFDGVGLRRAFAVSLLANAASFGVGVGVNVLLGWPL
jgi:hypothetical protein